MAKRLYCALWIKAEPFGTTNDPCQIKRDVQQKFMWSETAAEVFEAMPGRCTASSVWEVALHEIRHCRGWIELCPDWAEDPLMVAMIYRRELDLRVNGVGWKVRRA